MKKHYLILILLIGLCFNQSRSTIFNTGSPDDLHQGYSINSNQSVADRIYNCSTISILILKQFSEFFNIY